MASIKTNNANKDETSVLLNNEERRSQTTRTSRPRRRFSSYITRGHRIVPYHLQAPTSPHSSLRHNPRQRLIITACSLDARCLAADEGGQGGKEGAEGKGKAHQAADCVPLTGGLDYRSCRPPQGIKICARHGVRTAFDQRCSRVFESHTCPGRCALPEGHREGRFYSRGEINLGKGTVSRTHLSNSVRLLERSSNGDLVEFH